MASRRRGKGRRKVGRKKRRAAGSVIARNKTCPPFFSRGCAHFPATPRRASLHPAVWTGNDQSSSPQAPRRWPCTNVGAVCFARG